MSTNDGVPYLDPEIAAGLSKRSPPSTDKVPTIQEMRAGEATFHAETIQYQKEMAPPGMCQTQSISVFLFNLGSIK